MLKHNCSEECDCWLDGKREGLELALIELRSNPADVAVKRIRATFEKMKEDLKSLQQEAE
ncbi:hypothetical protein C4565_03695 [Candidatus Parcubacteria bacterium]|nr:MAG: hypothetical protein C4565_03695 [Candidatus Parcubacteria bacterium]